MSLEIEDDGVGFDYNRFLREGPKDKLGIFTKQTMWDLVDESEGDYLKALDQRMAVNVGDLDWIATTTGTTGVPAPYPLTNRDLKNFWCEFAARGSWRCG